MIRSVRTSLVASLVLAGAVSAAPRPGVAPEDVSILRPDDGAAGAGWTGERMRGARERLKDVLPGRPG